MNAKDYIKIFEQSSDMLLVIDTSFIIVAASDNYLKTTLTVREHIVGCDVFKVFPDNPGDHTANGASIMRASFNRVLETKVPDLLPVVKYDIPKPELEGGGFEEKYWQATHSPLLDENNNVKYIIQRAKDVTENTALITQHEVEQKALKLVEDSEKRFNMMLMKSPFGFAFFKGKNMVITLANDTIKEIWGKGKDVEGKPLFDVLPELKDTAYPGLLGDVYTTGVPFQGNEILASFLSDGKIEDKYFNLVYQPYLEADETISGVTVIAHEVTAQIIVKKALEAQQAAELKALKLVEETNKRYYTMLMDSPFAFSIMKGKDMVITLANDLIKEFWGKGMDVEGKTLLQVLPELNDQPFPEMIDQVFTTGKPVYANEILAKLQYDDKLEDKYFNVVYQPHYEVDNSISGVIIIAYDVTEMVLARKKIEESDKRYNMMLMHSPFTFVVLKGKDLVVDLANDRIKAVWGRGNDVEGNPLLAIMPELSDTPFPALMDEVMATGIPFHGREVQSPHNTDGHAREEYFNFVFQPYWEADETISGITIIGYDVTEQVIAKRNIEASEHRYHNMIHSSPSMIAIFKGVDMIIEIANEAIIETWGKGKDIVGKPLLSIMPEIIEQGFDKILSDVYNTGIPFHAYEAPVSLVRNGKLELLHYTFVYQAQRNINGEIEGIAVIANEVTPQALLKNSLKESEERFRSLADNVPMHIFILEPNAEASVSYFNKYWLDYTGQTIDEALGRTWDGIIHPDDVQIIMDVYVPAFEKRQPCILPAIRVKRYDGAYRWFQVHANPRYLPNGEFMGFIGAGFDIHESKLAVNALKESEERFQAAVSAVEGIVWTNNAKGEMEGAQIGWGSLTGQNYEAYQGYGWADAIHPDEAQPTLDAWNEAVRDRKNFVFEHRVKYKNGNWGHFSVHAIPLLNADESIREWVGVHTDISERKLAEDKLKESEERFRFLVMQAPVSICVLRGEDFIIETMNQEMANFLDRKIEESLHKPLFEVIAEVKDQVYKGLLYNVYSTGNRFVSQELPLVINRNGRLEDVFIKFVYEPLREADGTISGVMVLADEITDQVNARKKIEAQVIMHEDMLMNAPYVICTLEGPNHVYSFVNEQYQQLFGSRILKGKPFLKVIPEFEGQGFDTILDNIYNTGETFVGDNIPATFPREEGHTPELRYFNFSYQPLFDENRKIYSILGFGYEVTEVVKAKLMIEKSELQFRVLTNSMPQKITNADAEGNVNFFNQQWIDDTGLTFEELRDWGWEKSIHTDDLKLTVANWKHSVATGDVFDMECRIQNKEGDYRWHLSRSVPIKDEKGKILMWVGSFTDIHELKEAKRKAETAMHSKQQFLSNMSHEIRTPMNAIIGFTNVVLKTELNKEQKEYINAIKVSGDALIVLINDILDIAKVDAGKMTFEQIPFDLSASISATLHLFELKTQEKNIELIENYDATIPEILIGDSVRLRQIILNLLSNAVKFTDEGKITVTVRMLKEEADSIAIQFSVTDTGIGIPENILGHIFDDFQQATNETSRLHGGTGLGLSIVKQFVELQGGNLFVNSKQGEGSTFGFMLNFKKATAQTTEVAEIIGTNNGVELAERIENIRILVAEDMPLNQLLIKIILEDFGFDVDIAGNGKIAIEKLQENKYDIILMDLQMPELNGFEATEHIRSKMNSQIPIIALTADVTTVDVGKCEAVGMNDYISKPIDEKLLYNKIIKYLKKTN